MQFVIVYSYRILFHPLHSYPGPFIAKFTDWYGGYYAIRRQLHFVTFCDHQKYGSVIRQGPNKLVFNSVQALHDIYQTDRLFKSDAYFVTRVVPTAVNLFNVVDKQVHRVKRRIIGQGINERALRQFEPVMLDQITIFLKEIAKACDEERSVDMTEQCNYLGLDISGELGFGQSFHLQIGQNRWMYESINQLVWRLNVYMQYPMLKRIGWEKLLLPFILPKVKRFHRLIQGMVKQRLKEGKNARPDLLANIADYKDPETGKQMDKTEMFSESTFFITAGMLTGHIVWTVLTEPRRRHHCQLDGCQLILSVEISESISETGE